MKKFYILSFITFYSFFIQISWLHKFIASETCMAQIVSLGKGFTHAVCNDGSVWAWGIDNAGQLGDDATFLSQSTPIPVSSLSNFISISSGVSHTIALNRDGTVWAWGTDGNGQLGDDASYTDSPIPVQVATLRDIIAIAAGGDHCLALKNDGTVYAWGHNNSGQLGDGTNIDQPMPILVSGLSDIIQIAGGINHSLALKSDGTLYSWGQDNSGQLGDDASLTDQWRPVLVATPSDIVQIASGWNHSLALRNDGTVWTWGSDINGALGDDALANDQAVPVIVSRISDVISIGSGGLHSIVLKNDGTVWTWGDDFYGQLGDDAAFSDQFEPVQVSGLSDVNFIASGSGYHNVAIKTDGSVWSWGSDQHGELGDDATIATKATPVQVSTSLCGGMPLPINLLYFNANLMANHNVLLTWASSSEAGNDYYEIERSEDAVHFEKIAQIKGANYSIKTIHYSYCDKKSPQVNTYYRLKQTDLDATQSVSKIVSVQAMNMQDLLPILIYSSDNKSNFQTYSVMPNSLIEIHDLTGKLIFAQYLTPGNNEVDLTTLSSGVYLLKMQAIDGDNAKLVLVNH